MSSDNFDNEVSRLYQQRKAQVIAPQISLKEPAKVRQLSTLPLLAILSAAGLTSFGIMAIISHLSNGPVTNTPLYNGGHQIDLTTIVPEEDEEKVITIITPLPPLPPKPTVKSPGKVSLLDANIHTHQQTTIEPEKLMEAQATWSNLPQLKEPELEIQPIYKVLPKYSQHALMDKQFGEIQFKYKITPVGEVENITIVKSSVSRKLQQSAKKALAKWRYTPSDNFGEGYEIIFEFTVDDIKK
jgi:TonB family protein